MKAIKVFWKQNMLYFYHFWREEILWVENSPRPATGPSGSVLCLPLPPDRGQCLFELVWGFA